MIQRLFVCGKLFWPAIQHCILPVYLSSREQDDLRFLTDEEKELLLPPGQEELISIDLCFSDAQDYTRFVLAYLLAEAP